ncbi:MAG: ogr/Delta-like zinc finger family protein [Zoogloeaceae bacterium]|jgi:hypothetical protein|nr:ogr/Delta-like zinc finger family protein [Zoogloeaceae bacterium]
MRINCPHCGKPARTRTSRELSPLSREAYAQCEDPACCHVFKVVISAVATIAPSLSPNPSVYLQPTKRGRAVESQADAEPDQLNLIP